jgi:hypothetical protein
MEAIMREYVKEWEKQSYDVGDFSKPIPEFYEKWELLIELVTSVKLKNIIAPIHRYALANTCAMKICNILNIKMTYI